MSLSDHIALGLFLDSLYNKSHGCLHALPGVHYPLSVHALLSEATNDEAVGFAVLSTPLGNHH